MVFSSEDHQTVDISDQILSIVNNTEGDLLVGALKLAQTYQASLPEGLERSLLGDSSQPISLRVYCLQGLQDEEALNFSLQSDAWQLRAKARDLILDQSPTIATQILLDVIDTGEMGEAQAAVTSLKRSPNGFSKINPDELPVELQLEYAHASGDPLIFGDPLDGLWLLRGGDVQLGKHVVFNNPQSQCMRCHKIEDHGGISGPALDGVAGRLTERELQEALLVPNKNVTKGFGEYSTMPSMGVLLNHRDLRDVIAYLKTLRKTKADN